MDIVIVSHIILLIAVASCVGSLIRVLKTRQTGKQSVVEAYARLIRKQTVFFNQLNLLEDNSNRYFQTLHEAGLPELLKIREQLSIVDKDIETYIDTGRIESAQELIAFIDNPTSKPHKELLNLTSSNLHLLYDWKDRGNNGVTACVIKLGLITAQPAAREEKEILRRKTIHSLEQLREVLLQERTTQRHERTF